MPLIFTDVAVLTPLVVTVNVVDVLPAGISTGEGTCAAAVLLLEIVTAAPPAAATPFRVTVPVELFPPVTDVGFKVTLESTGAVMVNVTVALA